MAPQLPFPCYLPAFAIVAPFAVEYGDIFSLACYLGYDRMERLSNRSKEQATRSPHRCAVGITRVDAERLARL
jgi:hypothetical protein